MPVPGDQGRSADLRESLRALTTRGRSFVAGGLTTAVCGILLAERDLVRLGVVIGLLPLLTALLISRSGQRLGLVRTIAANVVEVGQRATVQLEVTNLGSRSGRLLVEDHVPWALGHRPRFVIDPLATGAAHVVEYQVHAEVRGVYEVGPVRARVVDPFGMLALDRAFTRTSTIVVVPSTEALPPIELAGVRTGQGEDRPRPFSTGSVADATVRSYRQGDDLRRVHWPSTARTGELMVRHEEQPWQSRCTLLIDNRVSAHRGSGPGSSLERTIAAAASITAHLTRCGYQVRLVSADGDEVAQAWHHGDVGAQNRPVLERLAALPASTTTALQASWSAAAGSEDEGNGIVVGIFGSLTEHDRALLARLHRYGDASYAISLDVDTWTSNATSPTGSAWLRHHGWRAADLVRNGSLPAAWRDLAR